MGGYNSGSGRMAPKMDEFRKIDLSTFDPAWFRRQRRGQITWSRHGVVTGAIGYQLSPKSMELFYTAGSGDDQEDIREGFDLAFTDQPFGGQRAWITCRSCQRRCRVLIGGRRFRCRKCYGATYPSQYERFRCAGLVKAEKARERVGAEPGIGNGWPRKPKGMHWRTYRRLEAMNWDAVLALDEMLAGMYGVR